MSKEYYKKRIIDLRADIAREGAATLMQLARFGTSKPGNCIILLEARMI